ncbi:MAG TPA: DUF58 domain-containing protein [Steroidobacteraceae bacterium]|nr:DUF58 domain-containing protein [Steroidobacteraceae bacterium]
MRSWSIRRNGTDRLPLEFHRRRVYILPTGFGLLYAAILLGMLLAGLNYNNNIALALAFMLGSLGIVAMHYCHRNLTGLELVGVEAAPVFAGDAGKLRLELRNASTLERLDVELQAGQAEGVCVSLAPGERKSCDLPIVAAHRGRNRVARLALATRFPLRLFRAWAWAYDCAEYIAYPRPEGSAPPPLIEPSSTGRHDAPSGGDEDFAGLREYRKGDSPRSVSWKAYARSGLLLSKEYSGAARRWLYFDWEQTPGNDVEARLSQMTRWVIDAERASDAYALVLPGVRVDMGIGPVQRGRCLQALALHGDPLESRPP